MALIHGKACAVLVDQYDLSAYFNSADYSATLETAETTTFGATAKTSIAGLKDVTFSASGLFDPTLDAHMSGVLAALAAGTLTTASYVIGPAGSTGGYPKYTGEALLTSYQVSPPVGDVVSWSAEFQGTGAPTRTTY